MPRQGAVVLSDLIAPTLTLDCEPCGRRDVCSVARLQAKHGDARLTELRAFLTADCPKRAKRRFTLNATPNMTRRRRRGGSG
jgi:hypothetical protein